MLPTNQATFLPADFLELADGEMKTVIYPLIMSIKGEYFITNFDIEMDSCLTYPIPPDAVGLKLKDLFYVDADGKERQVHMLNPNDAQNNWANYTSPYFIGFYIQENSVILFPSSKPDSILRMKIYKRASKLVPNDEGAQVVSVDVLNSQVTVNSVPTSWTTSDTVSVISSKPGFLTIVDQLEISLIASPVLTLSDVTVISEGDWICLDGESTIPQITPEAIEVLAQSVAVKCLEALGDQNGAKLAQAKCDEIKGNLIRMLEPRVDAQAKSVVNRTGMKYWSGIRRWGPW